MKRLVAFVLAVLSLAGAGLLFRTNPYWLTGQFDGLHDAAVSFGVTTPPRAEENAKLAARYLTASVGMGQVRRFVTATGTINVRSTVAVGSQLSGQVVKVFADFNDRVSRGQEIAELDQRGFEARLVEARAAVEVAKANVRIHEARVERALIDRRAAEDQRLVLQARIDAARVALEAAETDYRRKQVLRERGAASAREIEDAEARRDAAAAGLREAEAIAAAHENVVDGAKADLARSEAELASSKAALPQKTAALRLAEIDLERSTIRSPISGIVVDRNIAEGQTVAASLEAPTLFTIAGDLSEMEIHARVDETDVGQIEVGQKATFTVDSHPDREFSATVTQVRKGSRVVQNVVTYTVVLVTSNEEDLLLPGMTAVVRITTLETESGPLLPLAALRFSPEPALPLDGMSQEDSSRGRPALVWVAEAAGQPRPVTIGIGPDDASHAMIESGPLQAGDEVIVGEVAAEAPRRLFGIRMGF